MTARTILTLVAAYGVTIGLTLRCMANIRRFDEVAAGITAEVATVNAAVDELVAEYIDNLIADALAEADG